MALSWHSIMISVLFLMGSIWLKLRCICEASSSRLVLLHYEWAQISNTKILDLWHHRLGRLNPHSVHQLGRNNLSQGIPSRFLRLQNFVRVVLKANNFMSARSKLQNIASWMYTIAYPYWLLLHDLSCLNCS
jgi:hypothetical protein